MEGMPNLQMSFNLPPVRVDLVSIFFKPEINNFLVFGIIGTSNEDYDFGVTQVCFPFTE